jgi:hypothetical protein
MTPLAHHICLRLKNDQVIAPTPEQRRILARVVLTKGKSDNLLAFSLADTHLHLLSACMLGPSRELARRIELSLHFRLGLKIGFAPAHAKPVRDNWHNHNTFSYIMGQDLRHELKCDPFREASNLPDLLGLRPLGAYTARNVRQMLTRIKRRDLIEHFGVESLELTAKPTGPVLLQAGLMAAALPELKGRLGMETRRAIAEVASPHMQIQEIATHLGVSRQTVRNLGKKPADPSLVRAVKLQTSLILKHRGSSVNQEPFVGDSGRSPNKAAR